MPNPRPAPSLEMHVDRTPDGGFAILAPWLKEPVHGATFEEAYEEALRARRLGKAA